MIMDPYVSVEEYLEGELHSQVRHEYVEGHVCAMAGASDDHNRIAGNIFSFLHSALRGKPCEPFINDMKVKIQLASAFYYPDVLVACDPTDKEQYYRERPVVIVEVRRGLLARRAGPVTNHGVASRRQRLEA
jgi:Uma2 family endonuclease